MDSETVRFLVRHLGGVLLLVWSVRLLVLVDEFPGCLTLLLSAPWLLIALFRVPVPDTSERKRLLTKLDSFRCGAHRAACRDGPENSIAALRKCAGRGCGLVEFDLSFTRDGVAVVFHDDTVDRLCTESGRIDQMTWSQVQKLDIAAKLPEKQREEFGVTHIATLDEMVEECLKLDMLFVIDIKCNDRRAVSTILALYEKHPEMYGTAMVSTFYPHLIYLLRRCDPKIVGCMAWESHFFSYDDYSPEDGPSGRKHQSLPVHLAARAADALLTLLYWDVLPYLCGLSVLLAYKDDVTADRVAWLRKWRTQNLRVLTWTVNDSAQKTFLADYLHVPYLTDSVIDSKHHLP